ncbi:hypothetical protein M422DRAFT_266035, partial [Sphaerobolus stellatus SS14]
TFEGYSPPDWAIFKAAIHEAFEGAFKEKRYTKQSLIQFSRARAAQAITSDTALRAYHREFQTITHYLIKEKLITDEERDRYFWFGLHDNARRLIELRLAITHPNQPRTTPYNFTEVFKAGKYVFDADSFQNSPPEGLDRPLTALQSKPQGGPIEMHTSTRLVHFPSTPTTAIQAADSIDTLVNRLKQLKVHDQDYATTYAQIQSLLPKPATVLNTAPCLFCKHPSDFHSTRRCPMALDYLQQGKISSVNNFWRWPNGERIPNHPQGIKFLVDQGQATSGPAATHQSLLFEVLPTAVVSAANAVLVEEEADDEDEIG